MIEQLGNTAKPLENLPENKQTNWLNIDHLENIVFRYVQKKLEFDEPIPEFPRKNERGRLHKIESILETPKQTFDKEELYPSLVDKATILFYLFIKNHPFVNGNKRIAIMATLFFTDFNGKWIRMHWENFYNLAKRVSESKSKEKDSMTEWISLEFTDHIK